MSVPSDLHGLFKLGFVADHASMREAALPRQLWDLDHLLAQAGGPLQWTQLHDYTEQRYVKETAWRGLNTIDGEPWADIDSRLEEWSACDLNSDLRRLVNRFQVSQIARAAQRNPPEWRARARRLQFAARCAALGKTGWPLWRSAGELQTLIPAQAQGRQLKAARSTTIALLGDRATLPRPLRDYPPQVLLWEHLGRHPDSTKAINELRNALTG